MGGGEWRDAFCSGERQLISLTFLTFKQIYIIISWPGL